MVMHSQPRVDKFTYEETCLIDTAFDFSFLDFVLLRELLVWINLLCDVKNAWVTYVQWQTQQSDGQSTFQSSPILFYTRFLYCCDNGMMFTCDEKYSQIEYSNRRCELAAVVCTYLPSFPSSTNSHTHTCIWYPIGEFNVPVASQ